MSIQVLPKVRRLIPSSFVVQALCSEGRRFHCGNCGDVMFVRFASGLCPLCFNGRKRWAPSEEPREVPHDVLFAGLLDGIEDEELDGFEAVEALASISTAHVAQDCGAPIGE